MFLNNITQCTVAGAGSEQFFESTNFGKSQKWRQLFIAKCFLVLSIINVNIYHAETKTWETFYANSIKNNFLSYKHFVVLVTGDKFYVIRVKGNERIKPFCLKMVVKIIYEKFKDYCKACTTCSCISAN